MTHPIPPVKPHTIAHLIFEYKGVHYPIVYDFGDDYNQESARYMFEEGNFCCDCNRSIFLMEQHPGLIPEELECNSEGDEGQQITLVSISVEGPTLETIKENVV